ncbi:hypothetical protein [Paenibacillus baimaensis]|uniref:hypothetical protein n=1 Tax=Paenibacillus baimaensis TaxID=2982185 RepID=UPI0021CF646C|nr:hypothetical protein [Paenibacillus sp. WQ 127069]
MQKTKRDFKKYGLRSPQNCRTQSGLALLASFSPWPTEFCTHLDGSDLSASSSKTPDIFASLSYTQSFKMMSDDFINFLVIT